MYEIGKTYYLPTTKITIRCDDGISREFTFVVLHDHIGDITGEPHQHIDHRFIDDATIELLSIKLDQITAAPSRSIIFNQMICYRNYTPIKKFTLTSRIMFMTIQKKHKHCAMQNNICPHQGCDLSNIPITKINGKNALVCPCHGLTWNTDTSKMIKRMPRKESCPK